MNREIEFRAWTGEKIIYHYLVARPQAADILRVLLDEDFAFKAYQLSEWKLMQFTGLKDNLGNKIYEGDIIKCNDGRIAEVIWNEWAWFIKSEPFSKMEKSYSKMNKEEGKSYILMTADRYGKLSKSEVIGNIYENFELLNQ